MKRVKMSFFLLILFLLAMPMTANGQEMKQVEKSLSSNLGTKVIPGDLPKKSLSIKQQSNSPADYPLKTDGSYVDTLWDSYGTDHDIYFETVSSYSATDMNVQILDLTDYYYLKDTIVTVEFLKNNGGAIEYFDFTEFDTSGSQSVRLNSIGQKSAYQNQPYIYLRVGVSEYSDDEYYSDVTQFKVKNPFYITPDKTPPSKPTVYTVSNVNTTVKGKAEAYSTVIVNRGSTTIGRGTALSNGTYSVTIPKQKAGTKLTIYARDRAGNLSSGATITVIDKTAPGKPTVYSIGDNQNIIRGKAEAGSKVIIKQGTTIVGQATATSSAFFTIKFTSIKKAGTTLTAYATDRAGNRSQSTVVKVIDKIPPSAPTVNKVTYTSTTVTGKAERGAAVYIFNGSTLIGVATSNSSGTYKAAIKPQKKGTRLEVILMDKARNQSNSTFSKVY